MVVLDLWPHQQIEDEYDDVDDHEIPASSPHRPRRRGRPRFVGLISRSRTRTSAITKFPCLLLIVIDLLAHDQTEDDGEEEEESMILRLEDNRDLY